MRASFGGRPFATLEHCKDAPFLSLLCRFRKCYSRFRTYRNPLLLIINTILIARQQFDLWDRALSCSTISAGCADMAASCIEGDVDERLCWICHLTEEESGALEWVRPELALLRKNNRSASCTQGSPPSRVVSTR